MLVLTRRENETIQIGPHITITVVKVGEGKTKIGISAPKDMPVHRGEVLERIVRECNTDATE